MADRSFGTLLLDPPYSPPTDKVMELTKWMKAESRILVLSKKEFCLLPGKLGWIQCDALAIASAFGHPAVRPVEIVRQLLAQCPSDPIIDPYMGSGTTLVAAKMLGRAAVGIEAEEKWCSLAVQRLNDTQHRAG